jgi:hypothetical protein
MILCHRKDFMYGRDDPVHKEKEIILRTRKDSLYGMNDPVCEKRRIGDPLYQERFCVQ